MPVTLTAKFVSVSLWNNYECISPEILLGQSKLPDMTDFIITDEQELKKWIQSATWKGT